MGGSPKISGGMTYAEQQALMEKEHAFQAEQEKLRIKAAQDAETQRVARERADREQIKAQEEAAKQESTRAEQEAILESQAQVETETADTIKGRNSKLLDFYSNLYNGVKP
jgi:hypothetical protein